MTELLKVLYTAVRIHLRIEILSVKGLTQRFDVAMTSLSSDKDSKDKTKIDLIYTVQKEFSIVSKNRKIKPNFIKKKKKAGLLHFFLHLHILKLGCHGNINTDFQVKRILNVPR